MIQQYRDIIQETLTTLISGHESGHERTIPFVNAVKVAQQWQTENPDWLVCGSLALMASGHMLKVDVSDIDFVSNRCPNQIHYNGNIYPKSNEGHPYYHFEPANRICLFVFPTETHQIKVEPRRFHGLKLQNIENVLYWKKIFNRKKDREDLVNINSINNILPDNLFEI